MRRRRARAPGNNWPVPSSLSLGHTHERRCRGFGVSATDRTVHAECEGFEVVRYDRAGKWYVEPRNGDRPPEHVGVGEAARRAASADVLGGVIHFGARGGDVFDRKGRRYLGGSR